MEQNGNQLSLEEALKLKAEREKELGITPAVTQTDAVQTPELSPWQKFKAAQGNVKPWDMLRADGKTTDDIAHERYNMCQNCEHFIKLTKQCKKCGCFMNLKTKLAGAECPEHKWSAVDILEEGQ